ncbi:MAG TPA: hypothetical protein VN381_15650 [Anaerovoracaceae bacterium]|nr:hypothetical protein [Anaerovoracaceae bacterium]
MMLAEKLQSLRKENKLSQEKVASGFYLFMSMLILLAGALMAWNLWSDPDKKRRAKNAWIELGYCLTVYFIMTIGTPNIGNVFSGLISIVCCVVYIKIINPKFMKRKIFK